MEKIFSEIDLQQIVKRGNSLEKIMQQLHYFKNGIPTINLLKIATINDGIFKFSEKEVADGLILTCQAHPTSASIRVDFDDV